MMGRREGGQGQFFYAFDLDEVVPRDHLVRQIDAVLDLNWVHKELAPHYSHTGRPSIDPILMIRMLIVGYVFAIRSERRDRSGDGSGSNSGDRGGKPPKQVCLTDPEAAWVTRKGIDPFFAYDANYLIDN